MISKSLIRQIVLFLAFTSTAFAKYDRALVFQGGGFQTAIFLGMLDGSRSQGFNPDVIVSTCGSSIANAIASVFPDSKDQRAFVESERFYNFVKSIGFTERSNLLGALEVAAEMHIDATKDIIPDLFGKFLLTLPQEFGVQELEKPFPTEGMHSIMVGSRLAFSAADAGKPRNGWKWFEEIFFTDSKTASLLQGFKSPIAENYPDSSVHQMTDTITNVTVATAARASISDPYYMEPKKIGDSYYMTGAIDLYPNELAHAVANETVEMFSTGFDTIVEEPAIASTFHYDNNARLRSVGDQYSDYWIDLSDFGDFNKTNGLNPALSLKALKMKSGVPATYAEYLLRVEAEWNYGRERVIAALKQPSKNEKSHIRHMDKDNSSDMLRSRLSR